MPDEPLMYCLVSKIWGDIQTKLFTSAEDLEAQTTWLTTQVEKWQKHYEIIAIYRLMHPMTYEQYLLCDQCFTHGGADS